MGADERDPGEDTGTPGEDSVPEGERIPEERLAAEEAEEAGDEASRIGGRAPGEELPEPERPVAEGGGGEAEGFEQAEAELIESASHGDPVPDPTELAGEPEDERGRATHGEPDRAASTQRTEKGEEGRAQ